MACCSRSRRHRGQSVVEFAIALPLLLLLLAGGSDLARIYFVGDQIADAAREAALYAAHHPGYTAGDLRRIVNRNAGGSPLRCPTFTVSVPPSVAGAAGTTEQQVTIGCDMALVTGVMRIPSPVHLTATATAVVR